MDPDKIVLWISIFLSVLLLLERGYAFYRSLKTAPSDDKQKHMDYLAKLDDIAAASFNREQLLEDKLTKLQEKHTKLETYVKSRGYRVSFDFVPYPPSITNLHVETLQPIRMNNGHGSNTDQV